MYAKVILLILMSISFSLIYKCVISIIQVTLVCNCLSFVIVVIVLFITILIIANYNNITCYNH